MIDYKNKYIKYKIKYLQLKGGMNPHAIAFVPKNMGSSSPGKDMMERLAMGGPPPPSPRSSLPHPSSPRYSPHPSSPRYSPPMTPSDFLISPLKSPPLNTLINDKLA